LYEVDTWLYLGRYKPRIDIIQKLQLLYY